MAQTPDNEPAPTRPTWRMLVIALVAIAVAEVAYNWNDISARAHVPEIKHALGLD